jgi:hypothetical protein
VLLPAIIQVQWKPNVICGGAEERDWMYPTSRECVGPVLLSTAE